jgi:hypothetical protein
MSWRLDIRQLSWQNNVVAELPSQRSAVPFCYGCHSGNCPGRNHWLFIAAAPADISTIRTDDTAPVHRAVRARRIVMNADKSGACAVYPRDR